VASKRHSKRPRIDEDAVGNLNSRATDRDGHVVASMRMQLRWMKASSLLYERLKTARAQTLVSKKVALSTMQECPNYAR
jgi:hypothetical protein